MGARGIEKFSIHVNGELTSEQPNNVLRILEAALLMYLIYKFQC